MMQILVGPQLSRLEEKIFSEPWFVGYMNTTMADPQKPLERSAAASGGTLWRLCEKSCAKCAMTASRAVSNAVLALA